MTDDEAAIADEIKQADEYKEAMYAAMISIEKLINPVAPPTAARRMDEHIGGASGPSLRARLPKLTLRSFDGDITKWPSFWDSFESTIHGNEELSDIDKFNYLKSLLEHTAKDAISGLTLTTVNYQEAVEILKRRFGSKQQIISKHMDILLNLDPVVSTSVKALRHLHDHVESHVCGLKALGVNSETYGSLLLSVLLSKLPADIRLIASREISEDEWSLDALLKIMERETVARERVGTNHQRTMERTPPTAVALMNEFSTNVPTCCYCQQLHSSNNCKSVTNVGERKEILKRAGRCYTCLRKGHVSHSCRSAAKCHKCKGRHHSSICTMKPSENSTPKDPVSLSTTAHQKPVQPEVPTASTTKPDSTQVHLPFQRLVC